MPDFLTVKLDLNEAEKYVVSEDFINALRSSTNDLAIIGLVMQSAQEKVKELKEKENNGNS